VYLPRITWFDLIMASCRKNKKTDSLASPMTHAFFLLSDIAVEFQSYPSMKWKPAQFELCVVQLVSRVDVDCCLPLRHLVNFTVLLDFIRTASHDKNGVLPTPKNKTNQNNSSWTLNSSST